MADEGLVTRLKAELAALRLRLPGCGAVAEYLALTDQAAQITKAALSECKRLAAHKARAAVAQQPAAAAAAAAADVADADAAQQAGGAASCFYLLPDEDDGVSCLLLRLPKAWSQPRLQAYVERFGVKPASISKAPTDPHALLVFSTPADRAAFASAFRAQADAGKAPGGGAGGFLLKLPGQAKVAQGSSAGGKRGPGGAADGDERPPKAVRTDIRQAVCPWWDRPYREQLADKMATVRGALGQLTDKAAASYGRHGVKPEWLAAAGRRPDRVALPLPGIVRSPQLEGYRNKAEFTLGLDSSGQPRAGFLLGNFVDGVTSVSDPAQCRHISATALAYAAAMTSFLRSSGNELPVWDKRVNKGFWRLITVREGRSPTFLPLPVLGDAAASADADTQQQQLQQQAAALPACKLADVPVSRWLVRSHDAAAGGDVVMEEEGGGGSSSSQEGLELSQVTEAEPPSPLPAEVMVLVQVDPTAAPGGPDQIRAALGGVEAALRGAAAQQALPLTWLLVQYHSGVSNAAPANAPVTLFPGSEIPGGRDASGSFNDGLCELTFQVSPTAFYQVNPGATCLLYNSIGRMAAVGPQTLLLDVCCGTGTIGLTLAKQVAAVVGIDNTQSAIDDAARNAAVNGITNATFVCGKAEDVITAVLEEHIPRYSHVVAVVDPPRAGLHRSVLTALLGCAALKRLVYVSCNPGSLAANGGVLCGAPRAEGHAGSHQRGGRGNGGGAAGGAPAYVPFRPSQVLAFDMFPHTAHVETLMLFERE